MSPRSRFLVGRALRLLVAFVGASFAAPTLAHGIPEMLIVQRLVDTTRAGDPNEDIGDYVAQELSDDGRVSPIYWSKNDPIFRSMLQSGKVDSADVPSVDDALDVAKRLRFAYVLFVEAHRDSGGSLLARAELYKADPKPIWVDPTDTAASGTDILQRLVKSGKLSQLDADKLSESNGYRKFSIGSSTGLDKDNTMRSIAHTWVVQLGTTVLGGLQPKPAAATPDPVAGQLARLETTQPQLPKNVDDAQVFKNVDAALRDGHKDGAILILRDAVDQQPFDLPRREALIKLLGQTGRPELAANEAALSAALNPANGDFRMEGARAQLAAGNLDDASNTAKEALARDPKNADATLVLGEVSLRRLDFAGSIKDFDAACAVNATTEAVYYRAIAKAWSGDVAGAAADCDAAHHGSVLQPVPPYAVTIAIYDAAADAGFDSIRNLLPNVSLGAGTADLSAQVTKLQNAATAASAFLSSWQPAKNHGPSHERRILALNLLSQACGEIVTYLSKRDDETLTDARIDLGEAMKQYKSARELFAGEAAG